MNAFRPAPPLLLALLPILATSGCERAAAPTPPVASTAPAPATATPHTALGRVVDTALQKARREMETGNISISGGVHINVNGHEFNRPEGASKAEISPQGDLLIEGRAVAVTPAQRALLLDYRGQIIAVAESGMAMGVKGADLAGKALSETFSGLVNGDSEQAKQRIEAEGRKLEADARRLCGQLPRMLATQQQLATSLPAFKPYATMTQEDVDDCMKHDKGGVSVGDASFGQAIREEIRQGIREDIRKDIRGAVGRDETAPAPATSG